MRHCFREKMVRTTGFEPAIFSLRGKRVWPLHYARMSWIQNWSSGWDSNPRSSSCKEDGIATIRYLKIALVKITEQLLRDVDAPLA